MATWKKVLTEADIQTGTLGSSTTVVPSESTVANAISSATSSFGSGTVTSVGTSGSVNGITLTGGPITTSGTITLGGTLANIPNSALSNDSVTIGTTEIDLGASSTTLAGLASVTSTTFVGALTGDVTGDVTGDITGQVLSAAQSSITSIANLATVGTIATGVWQGTAIADAYVANDLTISGGAIDSTPIGATTASTGAFTTLSASNGITGALTGNVTGNLTGTATNATNVGTAAVNTGDFKLALVSGGGGNDAVKYDSGLSWNAASDTLTVANLTVAGTTTTVNSTDLAIADKLITLASGSTSAANATGSGIYIGIDEGTNAAGDLPRLKWNNGGAISGWAVADFNASGSTEKPIAVMTLAQGAASGTTVGQFHVNTTSGSEALYIYI